MYGKVRISRPSSRKEEKSYADGTLLGFQVIPIMNGSKERHIVYGVVETDEGDFLARQLSEIKRIKE